MEKIPNYIHRLLSSCQVVMPDAPQTPNVLAEIWPLNGDKVWAEACLAWLDHFLLTNPTPYQFAHVYWQGWHDNGFLPDKEDYRPFFIALRNRLAREIPNWRRRHFKFPGMPKDDA